MADDRIDITDKQTVIEVLSRLPDRASLDEIREQFDTIYQILANMREAEGGRTFSQAEVEEDLRKWLEKSAGRPALAAT
jgi:hypothetical protein